MPVTRAAQAAVRALVACGRVLKDGRQLQRLDVAQRCAVTPSTDGTPAGP